MKLLGRKASRETWRSPDLDEVRVAHACASWLIAYPDDELLARLGTIEELAAGLPRRLSEPLGRTVDAFRQTGLTALCEQYVETFDTRRRGCLYLTYYSNGDTRRRGMALVGIREKYREAGLELTTDELPDHLMIVLEFSAGTSVETGLEILVGTRPGIELLRTHLSEVSSPWHGAIEAVCATLPRLSEAEAKAMMELAANGPEEEMVGLDGYGSATTADNLHPASRPGPTFAGTGIPGSSVTATSVPHPKVRR